MSHSDIRIFDCVSEILGKKLIDSEAQSILSEIREKYYSQHLSPPHYQSLAKGISSCRTCPLAIDIPITGWWNWQDCDLLIISSNPYDNSSYTNQLGQTMSSAGFSSAFCGGIHVTKCKFSKIEDSHIDNCRDYIYDQIDVAKPKAIIVTGAVAYDCFSNTKKYSEAIGSSWWEGLYKIYCLPLLKDLDDPRWLEMLRDIYIFIYGNLEDVFTIQ